jgi:hypothetical protein
MQCVDWAVDQALSNGLSIILDLHHYDELHAHPDGHAERFLAALGALRLSRGARAGPSPSMSSSAAGETSTAVLWKASSR